jgi:hypothetical protein
MKAAHLPIQRPGPAKLLVVDQAGHIRRWPRPRIADLFRPGVSMANCQIGLSAVVFEVLIPLPECATSLSYSFI